MNLDPDVCALVRQARGDLLAAGILLDRLHDLGDRRWLALLRQLGRMLASSVVVEDLDGLAVEAEGELERSWSLGDARNRRARTWEKWVDFVEEAFWPELAPPNLTPMQVLASAQQVLGTYSWDPKTPAPEVDP